MFSCLSFIFLLYILCRFSVYSGSPRVLLFLEGGVESMCIVFFFNFIKYSECYKNSHHLTVIVSYINLRSLSIISTVYYWTDAMFVAQPTVSEVWRVFKAWTNLGSPTDPILSCMISRGKLQREGVSCQQFEKKIWYMVTTETKSWRNRVQLSFVLFCWLLHTMVFGFVVM